MTAVRMMAAGSALAWAALAGTPAAAQQAVGGGFSVSGGVAATTDYRFRGISRSGEDPALQGTVTVDHDSGFYAGFWASTLGDNPRLGNGEVDLYAGYTREIATATNLDIGVTYYAFPSADRRFGDSDYVEPYASVSHTIGPVTAEVGAAYAPEQDALGGEDNLYLYADVSASIPFTPLAASARVGRSDGGLAAGGDYFDWRVGVEARSGPATFSLDYVDTDLPSGPDADSALVASVRLGF